MKVLRTYGNKYRIILGCYLGKTDLQNNRIYTVTKVSSQLAIVNLLSKMKCLFSAQVVFVPGQVVTRPPKVLTGDHIHAI